VPWSGFDLINAFNAWKRSEAAGRSFVVAPDATITKHVTAWYGNVKYLHRYSRKPPLTLVAPW